MPGEIFRRGTQRNLRAIDHKADLGPLSYRIEVDPAIDEGLGEVSTSRFKAICSDGDWPLNLVGLKDFSDFSQWEEVHHFAHHVLVVVVVAAEVTPQTVKVFLTTSFGVK